MLLQVSSKIDVISALIDKSDKIILGGGMIFTFFRARGLDVGSSLVEEDKIDLARTLEEDAKKKGVEFILPTDVIIADKFAEDAENKVVPVENIPDGWMVCSALRICRVHSARALLPIRANCCAFCCIYAVADATACCSLAMTKSATWHILLVT